jgi:hypothetical protein
LTLQLAPLTLTPPYPALLKWLLLLTPVQTMLLRRLRQQAQVSDACAAKKFTSTSQDTIAI